MLIVCRVHEIARFQSLHISTLLVCKCTYWVCLCQIQINEFKSWPFKDRKEVSDNDMTNLLRSFRNVVNMVQQRLQDLTPELINNLWRHVIRYLVGYLVLEPIWAALDAATYKTDATHITIALLIILRFKLEKSLSTTFRVNQIYSTNSIS